MKTRLELLRDRVLLQIRRNPAEVVITRAIRSSDGGGGTRKTGETTLPPQTVRIYMDKGNIVGQSAGQTMLVEKASLRLLAAHDADVRDGDTFTVGGETYRVRNPVLVTYAGGVIRIDAGLERGA